MDEMILWAIAIGKRPHHKPYVAFHPDYPVKNDHQDQIMAVHYDHKVVQKLLKKFDSKSAHIVKFVEVSRLSRKSK